MQKTGQGTQNITTQQIKKIFKGTLQINRYGIFRKLRFKVELYWAHRSDAKVSVENIGCTLDSIPLKGSVLHDV